jgi:hypothetical protein
VAISYGLAHPTPSLNPLRLAFHERGPRCTTSASPPPGGDASVSCWDGPATP